MHIRRIMDIKRKLTLILSALVLCASVFAENPDDEIASVENESRTDCEAESGVEADSKKSIVNWISTNPEWSLSFDARVRNYQNFMLYTLSGGATIEMDMNEIYGRTGFDCSMSQVNCTIEAAYAPTLFEKFNLGLILINHFNWYFDSYYEFDFLTGLYFSANPLSWLNIKFTALYQLKATQIFALANTSCSRFDSQCPAFRLEANFYPLDWLEASVSISSYDTYTYFLFFSPIVRLSLGYKCNEHLTLSVSGKAQFVDFFTLSANFNGLGGSVCAKWRF